jgi:alpha-tubulin suppressor-like RCC1 family protein
MEHVTEKNNSLPIHTKVNRSFPCAPADLHPTPTHYSNQPTTTRAFTPKPTHRAISTFSFKKLLCILSTICMIATCVVVANAFSTKTASRAADTISAAANLVALPNGKPYWEHDNATVAKTFGTMGNVFVLDSLGRLWGWGYNNYNQINPENTTYVNYPMLVYPNLIHNQTGGILRDGVTTYTIADIKCNQYAIVLRRNDGALFGWGYSYQYMLDDAVYNTLVPTPKRLGLTNNLHFSDFALGIGSIYAVRSDASYVGELWTVGYNNNGYLGNGNTTSQQVFTINNYFKTTNPKVISKVYARGYASYFITSTGELWGCGRQNSGALGNGGTSGNVTTPIQIAAGTTFKFLSETAGVSVDIDKVVAVDSTDHLWAWGSGAYGVLGNKNVSNNITTAAAISSPEISSVTFPTGSWVYTSQYTTVAYSQNTGKTYAFGYNNYGQYNGGVELWKSSSDYTGDISIITPDPKYDVTTTRYCGSTGFILGAAANNETKGRIYAFGMSNTGVSNGVIFGNKNTAQSLEPIDVLPVVKKWKKVEVTTNGGYALDENGKFHVWGSTQYFGNGDVSTYNVFTPMMMHHNKTFTDFAINTSGGILLDTAGNAWVFGINNYGQLARGDATTNKYNIIYQVSIPDTTFKGIAAGDGHFMLLDTTGKIWTWGRNTNGQCGFDTTNANVLEPTKIMPDKTFMSIAAATISSYAITTDNDLYSWGGQQYGFLGDGEISGSRFTPQIVGENLKFKKIFAITGQNKFNIFATDMQNHLYAWGMNTSFSLGIGAYNSYQPVPTLVDPDLEIDSVYSSYEFTYVRTIASPGYPNGRVYGCGYSYNSSYAYSCFWGDQTLSGQINTFRALPFLDGYKYFSFDYQGINSCYGISEDGYLTTWGAYSYSSYYALHSQWASNTNGMYSIRTPILVYPFSILAYGYVYSIATNITSVYYERSYIGETASLHVTDYEKAIPPSFLQGRTFLGYCTTPQNANSGTNIVHALSNPSTHTVVVPFPQTYTLVATFTVNSPQKNVTADTTSFGYRQLSQTNNSIYTTYYLDASGYLYGTGQHGTSNYYLGATPQAPSVDYSVVNYVPIYTASPTATAQPSFLKLKKIIGGGMGSWGIDENDKLLRWGYGRGWVNNGTSYSVPTAFMPSMSFRDVATHQQNEFTYLIDTNGQLYSFGINDYGQLGNGTTTANYDLQVLLPGIEVKQVVCGYYAAHAITADGRLFSWGYGQNYQFGNGAANNIYQYTPVQNTDPSCPTNIKRIWGGTYHTFVEDSNGRIYGFGLNSSGQLGLGDTTTISTMRQITAFAANEIKDIFSPYQQTTLFLKTDGTLWGAGNSYNVSYFTSQYPVSTVQNTPVEIIVDKTTGLSTITTSKANFKLLGGATQIVNVADSDGNLWTWGSGTSMGLGYTNVCLTTPTKVISGHNHTTTKFNIADLQRRVNKGNFLITGDTNFLTAGAGGTNAPPVGPTSFYHSTVLTYFRNALLYAQTLLNTYPSGNPETAGTTAFIDVESRLWMAYDMLYNYGNAITTYGLIITPLSNVVTYAPHPDQPQTGNYRFNPSEWASGVDEYLAAVNAIKAFVPLGLNNWGKGEYDDMSVTNMQNTQLYRMHLVDLRLYNARRNLIPKKDMLGMYLKWIKNEPGAVNPDTGAPQREVDKFYQSDWVASTWNTLNSNSNSYYNFYSMIDNSNYYNDATYYNTNTAYNYGPFAHRTAVQTTYINTLKTNIGNLQLVTDTEPYNLTSVVAAANTKIYSFYTRETWSVFSESKIEATEFLTLTNYAAGKTVEKRNRFCSELTYYMDNLELAYPELIELNDQLLAMIAAENLLPVLGKQYTVDSFNRLRIAQINLADGLVNVSKLFAARDAAYVALDGLVDITQLHRMIAVTKELLDATDYGGMSIDKNGDVYMEIQSIIGLAEMSATSIYNSATQVEYDEHLALYQPLIVELILDEMRNMRFYETTYTLKSWNGLLEFYGNLRTEILDIAFTYAGDVTVEDPDGNPDETNAVKIMYKFWDAIDTILILCATDDEMADFNGWLRTASEATSLLKRGDYTTKSINELTAFVSAASALYATRPTLEEIEALDENNLGWEQKLTGTAIYCKDLIDAEANAVLFRDTIRNGLLVFRGFTTQSQNALITALVGVDTLKAEGERDAIITKAADINAKVSAMEVDIQSIANDLSFYTTNSTDTRQFTGLDGTVYYVHFYEDFVTTRWVAFANVATEAAAFNTAYNANIPTTIAGKIADAEVLIRYRSQMEITRAALLSLSKIIPATEDDPEYTVYLYDLIITASINAGRWFGDEPWNQIPSYLFGIDENRDGTVDDNIDTDNRYDDDIFGTAKFMPTSYQRMVVAFESAKGAQYDGINNAQIQTAIDNLIYAIPRLRAINSLYLPTELIEFYNECLPIVSSKAYTRDSKAGFLDEMQNVKAVIDAWYAIILGMTPEEVEEFMNDSEIFEEFLETQSHPAYKALDLALFNLEPVGDTGALHNLFDEYLPYRDNLDYWFENGQILLRNVMLECDEIFADEENFSEAQVAEVLGHFHTAIDALRIRKNNPDKNLVALVLYMSNYMEVEFFRANTFTDFYAQYLSPDGGAYGTAHLMLEPTTILRDVNEFIAAYDRLNDARQSLLGRVDLLAAVAEYSWVVPSHYKIEPYADFQAIRLTALECLTHQFCSPEMVRQCTENLAAGLLVLTQIENIVYNDDIYNPITQPPPNKEELLLTIVEYKEFDPNSPNSIVDYDNEYLAGFRDAYDEMRDTYNNKDATDTEIALAIERVRQSLRVNREILSSAIATIEGELSDPSKYTLETWQRYQNALATARLWATFAETPYATPNDIKNARDSLYAAYGDLEYRNGGSGGILPDWMMRWLRGEVTTVYGIAVTGFILVCVIAGVVLLVLFIAAIVRHKLKKRRKNKFIELRKQELEDIADDTVTALKLTKKGGKMI